MRAYSPVFPRPIRCAVFEQIRWGSWQWSVDSGQMEKCGARKFAR